MMGDESSPISKDNLHTEDRYAISLKNLVCCFPSISIFLNFQIDCLIVIMLVYFRLFTTNPLYIVISKSLNKNVNQYLGRSRSNQDLPRSDQVVC